ncbi:lipopolysaccharide biosynthesis protein [Alkaliflexus imshenetskii]|uniref:lipopolysaccharide biosynthesis protein n=1 Tax=Alkaliflexus imshenetskii TaxID=286730 RepID=UPI0004798E31|nr:polysaccharide biosynthesis C-terminal domain-containing protein [Alkaliflexus imshenetskii]
MSTSLKSLAGETVIYGATTMIGRLLNWLLMPFYIRTITTQEYGAIVNIYGIISILLVMFTYGLETGFFRFSRLKQSDTVYKTSIIMLAVTSAILVLFMAFLSPSISSVYYDGQYSASLLLMGLIVAFDSFLAIPFANLRLHNRSVRFGVIKLISIFSNIFLNLFFLLFIPWLIRHDYLPESIVNLYNSGNGVFYILLSNAISSIGIIIFFLPEFFRLKGSFDTSVLKSLMVYSWPVLVVGITGMLTQNSDKILMPRLIGEDGFHQLAIYGANFKIGVLMSLFTQSFRFAFEPYFFKNQDKGVYAYARIMDYFVFFGIFIFLGVMLYLDVINILLTAEYIKGNLIIPFVLVSQLFYGIYFNLSLWYKLTDKTYFGAIFGIIGMLITITLNFVLIPKIGILGGALAMLAGYGIMVLVSYFIGQKFYPVPYNLKRIALYILFGTIVFTLDNLIGFENIIVSMIFKTTMYVLFVFFFLALQRKSVKL